MAQRRIGFNHYEHQPDACQNGVIIEADTAERPGVDGSFEFDGLDDAELEAIVATALNIPPERGLQRQAEPLNSRNLLI